MCIEHQQLQCWVRLTTLSIARGDYTTHSISDKSYQLWLPPPLNAQSIKMKNHDGDQQSHHNDQPLYQRIALVKKKSSNDVTFYAQLMSEHAEDLRYKPCATVDLSCPCRPMPLNDHNNCDRHNSCWVLNRLAIMRRPAFIPMLRTTNSVHAL